MFNVFYIKLRVYDYMLAFLPQFDVLVFFFISKVNQSLFWFVPIVSNQLDKID